MSGSHHHSRLISVSFWFAVIAGAIQSPAEGQVRWRTGKAPLAADSSEQAITAAQQLAARPDQRHLVVQFEGAVAPEKRVHLETAGLKLLSYLGDNAYFASTREDGIDAQSLRRNVTLRDAQSINREWKLHPFFARGDRPYWAIVPASASAEGSLAQKEWTGAYVLFHPDVSPQAAAAVVRRHPVVVRHQFRTVNGMVIELPLDAVGDFADEDAVQYLEPALPKMGVNNDSNRVITQADTVQSPPYGLDGSGVTVMVYDGGTGLDLHPDFGGRLHVRDASGTAEHSTHVAGTVGGAGTASNGLLRGMAPGVTIESYGFETGGPLQAGFLYTDPGDLETDYNQAINTYGADIANNSIGTNTAPNGFPCDWEGDYGVTDTVIDSIVRGGLGAPFRIVWANGNERQGSATCGAAYHTTAPPACAKNHITVGALNSNDDSVTSFTSWGPADDGRLKPDLSGPGCQSDGDLGVTSCSNQSVYISFCGTSMAAPTVAGCSALMLQDYRVQFPGRPDFRNSTLKILLAHTAQDVVATGPDYQSGYGSIRIQNAIDFMRTGNFLESQLTHDGVFSKVVVVPGGTGQLKLTLAWDDLPGTPNVSPALVNDLDLRVYGPNNAQSFPWTLNPDNPAAPAIRTQPDHVNNIEQVVVDAPAAGTWRIEVHGFNVPQGSQPFSLCSSRPLLDCASGGLVALDETKYSCNSSAQVRVIDCDLNTSNGSAETVSVSVASTTEPGGESLVLTETGPNTADFRGTISLSTTNAGGVLHVSNGDTVTATYVDADNGMGGTNVPILVQAGVDCQGPVISNIAISGITLNSAVISFNTHEPALGSVQYGVSCGALTLSTSGPVPKTSHTLVLSGLTADTNYRFAVEAADATGNATSDDNGGSCYSFTTAELIHNFPLNVDPGWTRQGQWAFGQPTGGGSSNRDPTAGITGTNVFGYNLSGDYANNLPATYLTTAAMDCSGVTGATLRFQRWLGVESNSAFDEATVEASNDGTNWTVIWRATTDNNGLDVSDSAWMLQNFDISSIADDQPTVYIRWGMGPTDTSVTFPGWNIDDVQISGFRAPLTLRFPDGIPATLTPSAATDIRVEIQNGTENYVSGSGTLHYRYSAGVYTNAALSSLGGNLYQATLPATGCNSTPEFYFSAQGNGGTTITSPPTAPLDVHKALMGAVSLVSDDFESVTLWTVDALNDTAQTGQWVRVDPIGSPAQPEDDHTPGAGSTCFVTGQEPPAGGVTNNDVDAGFTTLISPTFDLSAGADAVISYWRWYSNDDGSGADEDVFVIQISNNNGATWTLVEQVGPDDPQSSGGWFFHSFEVGDVIPMTNQMKMRFIASDFGVASLVEAAIDDFEVSIRLCDLCPQDPNKIDPGVCGCGTPDVDADSDGVIDCVDDCPATPACAEDVDERGCPSLDCHGTAEGCNADKHDVQRFVNTLVGQSGFDCLYDFDNDDDVDGVDIQPFMNDLLNAPS